MTAKKLAEKFGVNILKDGSLVIRRKRQWYAFRGGNGTGLPVEYVAQAYTLATLAKRLERIGKPLIDIL